MLLKLNGWTQATTKVSVLGITHILWYNSRNYRQYPSTGPKLIMNELGLGRDKMNKQ